MNNGASPSPSPTATSDSSIFDMNGNNPNQSPIIDIPNMMNQ